MSLTCELSGEPVATTNEAIVATPSGHICIKRLLLEKLAENGGVDPFETIRERPLSEEQLIELQTKLEPPPRPQATSLPNLLQMMQTEYDALVLELFDTRKALEEARRELSQALYQNDAAVRVVARLSMERDAARQELERWNASLGARPVATPAEATVIEPEGQQEPQSKRRKVEQPPGPLSNDVPEGDLTDMVETWQRLHPQRKPMLKAAAAAGPTPEVLARYTKKISKNWHKSTCRSVTCMAGYGDLLVTGGKDKQVVIYSEEDEVVKHSFNVGSVPTTVDIYESLVVVATSNGQILVYSAADGSTLGELEVICPNVVDVRVHPTTKHVCVATSDGRVLLCLLEEGRLLAVSEFKGEKKVEYTCGALHPDGLLYAAGTTTGEVLVWDFKNKVLASTMKDGDDAVATISFSDNGYHLATGHQSAAVRFWDLRKQKVIATMNGDASLLQVIKIVVYDDTGKFAAFGGTGGFVVTSVKEWGAIAQIKSDKPISGMVWTKAGIATCSDKERAISFYGPREE